MHPNATNSKKKTETNSKSSLKHSNSKAENYRKSNVSPKREFSVMRRKSSPFKQFL
jgi:hypothetical protein